MDNQNTSKIIKYYIDSHKDRIYLIFAINILFLFFAMALNRQYDHTFRDFAKSFLYVSPALVTFIPTTMDVKEMRNCLAYGCTRRDIAKSISFMMLIFSAILFLEFMATYFTMAFLTLSNKSDILNVFLSNLNAFIKMTSIPILILVSVNILSSIGKKDLKTKEKKVKIIFNIIWYFFIFFPMILKPILYKYYIQNLNLLSSIILYVVSMFLTYIVNHYILGKSDF